MQQIQKLYENDDNDNNDNDDIENFTTEEKKTHHEKLDNDEDFNDIDDIDDSNDDKPVEGFDNNTFENFNESNNVNINDYYKKTVPMYNEASIQHIERDELLKKLNYMIHLLEEQKNENTGHITEDLILYSFLGIFIIFVLDSFARVGKYVR